MDCWILKYLKGSSFVQRSSANLFSSETLSDRMAEGGGEGYYKIICGAMLTKIIVSVYWSKVCVEI